MQQQKSSNQQSNNQAGSNSFSNNLTNGNNNNASKPYGNNKNSRNNKKKHHATHEAGNNAHNKNRQQYNNNYATGQSGYLTCKICHEELKDLEKEFFPCNCKYKICQKCFKHQVDAENGKCPNCGLLYEMQRVTEYYASKAKSMQSSMTESGPLKKTRCDSPQPTSAFSAAALGIPQTQSLHNQQRLGGKNGQQLQQSNNAPKHSKGQKNSTRQNQQAQNALRQQAQQFSNRQADLPESNPKKESDNPQIQQSGNKQQIQGSYKPLNQDTLATNRPQKKQRNSSEQQRLQQKLSSVRILQRNTLYLIGLSPNVAKEETLRRFEYFSQYGRILSVTINKEKAFQSENQGLCYSAYLNYQTERDASLAILAVDQFVFDGRLIHASYGRTKYCRFFLKGTNCLNHDCPYLHQEANPENILTQEDMNKKILFQQCQQLALKLIRLTSNTEEQFRALLRSHKEAQMRQLKLTHTNRMIMPQLEQSFEKKGLFKHCTVNNFSVPTHAPLTAQQPLPVPVSNITCQQPQHAISSPQLQMKHPIQQPASSQSTVAPPGYIAYQSQQSNLADGQQITHPQQMHGGVPSGMHQLMPETTKPSHSAFKKHRGSEGCNSDNITGQNPNMMMFGGRSRLQSSGTLGELEFQNKNSGGTSRWQQLMPHGAPNQCRRFAQDDHYLTRVPAAYRLTGAAVVNPAQDKSKQTNMTLSNQQQTNQFGQVQPRFGSPHLHKRNFNQQFVSSGLQQQQTAIHQQNIASAAFKDSDKATQQSSTYLQHQQKMMHVSQLFPPHQQQVMPHDPRARSGSQAAAATGQQFEEAKMILERPRKSSHGKFCIPKESRKESKSPNKREQQLKFAKALTSALQLVKQDSAPENESTGHFSSIFAGNDRLPQTRIINFNQNNCSEGLVGGRISSPIRDSILQSRRNSQDYGTMNRPRSQHSLIVESVARILDDSALEQRGFDRQKLQRSQALNEPNFRTGPPSEVHQLMHDEQNQAHNSHFYADMESKWNNQFDMTSSNSQPLTSQAAQGTAGHTITGQRKMLASQGGGDQHRTQISGGNLQHTLTSPNINTSAGVWHQSNSLYNSPFFLIPTNTSNQQHRSAAFHDMSLRHLHSQSNPFSVKNHNQTMGVRANGAMVSDTWRLTYNPHPLLPGGPPNQSSNLSSGGAGGLFRNMTTQSDQEQASGGIRPMLSRTASQPFMMSSEQKVIRGSAPQNKAHRNTLNNSHLEMSSSQMKQAQLTQQNLELLNKRYCPSKDMLYAKIFTDFRPSSPSNMRQNGHLNSFAGAPQHPTSVQHFAPQSLFCFALDGDESNELRQTTKKHQLKIEKRVSRDDATGLLLTPDRAKEHSLFFNSSQLDKVKETSQTPTNKHSRPVFASNWNDYLERGDTRSTQLNGNQTGSGLMLHESSTAVAASGALDKDELEIANQLANEASLGFGDLISTMMHKSKKSKMSQHGAERTLMSAMIMNTESPPQRSRSQSYRDRQLQTAQAEESHQNKSNRQLPRSGLEEQPKNQTCIQNENVGVGDRDISNRRGSNHCSDSSHKKALNLVVTNKQPSSLGQSALPGASSGGQKSFYREFVKVQEGFRKSSGLISSSGFGATQVERRRSSYSQGRNSTHRTGIQLMEVTRRGSFKQGISSRKSLRISPLGFSKFKNHQIDEVNEDGATVLDFESQEPTSVRMHSTDRQSYNLKTLKSLSRSRKESHSQNRNACD